jgi:primosomal protein N' (replication factor Y) (superfamily II helicase)
MIPTPYVEVAVTLPVNHTYTYSIPDHFNSMVDVGMRVLVPFGRRRVTGYVLSGRETDGGYPAKHILDVLDGMPLFPGSMVEFFRWISEYYLYPLGEVIKSALPSGLSRQDVTVAALTHKGHAAGQEAKLTPGEAQIMDCLAAGGMVGLKQLAKKIPNVSIYSLIRKMEKAGLLETMAILEKEGVRVKTEKFIAFCRQPAGRKKLSRKRQQILDILSMTPEMSLSALKQKIPTAPTLVKFLAADGIIRISERQVFRDPLGDPVEPDTAPELTAEQLAAVNQVMDRMGKGFTPFLLCGVTGSGKTEVYMHLVAEVIKNNKKAIVLVPEISLISQTERRFRARFQNRIAVIHSGLSKGERLDQWYKS